MHEAMIALNGLEGEPRSPLPENDSASAAATAAGYGCVVALHSRAAMEALDSLAKRKFSQGAHTFWEFSDTSCIWRIRHRRDFHCCPPR